LTSLVLDSTLLCVGFYMMSKIKLKRIMFNGVQNW
jgi:hypothetical protein